LQLGKRSVTVLAQVLVEDSAGGKVEVTPSTNGAAIGGGRSTDLCMSEEGECLIGVYVRHGGNGGTLCLASEIIGEIV
jgi:hypothetical protein